MYRNLFYKVNGVNIPDIFEYLKKEIENDPFITISVGCDSMQERRKTAYVVSIIIYNNFVNKGVHMVYFKTRIKKIRDIQARLFKEAEYLNEVGTYIDDGLRTIGYSRRDLSDYEMKRYIFHLLKSEGHYSNIDRFGEHNIIKNLIIPAGNNYYSRLIDLHADFNPVESTRRNHSNKSFSAYKSYAPWLRGLGFRLWCKPLSFASSSGADLLLKNKKYEERINTTGNK